MHSQAYHFSMAFPKRRGRVAGLALYYVEARPHLSAAAIVRLAWAGVNG
jgi:hypothetical protein